MQMMKARPFRGGCSNGKQMVASKGIGNMKDMRIQYWDTTQATWYAGKILGMWKEKPRTHWLVFFDDGTEYAVGRTDDVWKLVRWPSQTCMHCTLRASFPMTMCKNVMPCIYVRNSSRSMPVQIRTKPSALEGRVIQ